jgi:hypothetical protein
VLFVKLTHYIRITTAATSPFVPFICRKFEDHILSFSFIETFPSKIMDARYVFTYHCYQC